MSPSAPSLKCSICGCVSIFVLFLAFFLPLMLGMLLTMSFVYACAVVGVFLIYASWRCCKRSGNKRSAVVFPFVLAVIIFEGLWTSSAIARGQNRVREQARFDFDRDELRQKLMIPLDSTTTVLNYDSIVAMDETIYLKLEMKSQDVASFINNSPFRDIKLQTNKRFVNNRAGYAWWHPENCTAYESAVVELPGAKYLSVLINRDAVQKVIIYLKWVET